MCIGGDLKLVLSYFDSIVSDLRYCTVCICLCGIISKSVSFVILACKHISNDLLAFNSHSSSTDVDSDN